MPHVNSSGGGGDDLGSEDEVKVFKDEGEEENKTSENLTEEKSSLIDLTESEVPIYNKQNLCPHACSLSLSLCHSSLQKSMCVSCVLQEKGSLAGGSYATTGKTSARSDLSPVFGEFIQVALTLYSVGERVRKNQLVTK